MGGGGFAALVAGGPGALAAEPLARGLGATKGSFYWHFTDLAAYRAALIAAWEAAAMAALQTALHRVASPGDRLSHLDDLAPQPAGWPNPAALETALRAWALTDHTVAEGLARVDAARLGYISAVLRALGLGNADFAQLVYGAQIGLNALARGSGVDTRGARSTLMAALSALSEA